MRLRILANIAKFSRLLKLQFASTLAYARKTSLTGPFFQSILIQAVAGQKLHSQFLHAIPLSLTTPVS
jgi:hypothetical protein